MKKLEEYVTSIVDFPQPGVIFRDITSVIQDPDGFTLAVEEMQKLVEETGAEVVCGAEARGFIFSAPIAYNLKKPLIPIRKKGKLPRETVEKSYNLEYGQATIEVHKDAIKPGQKVVIVDDLIATGGTVKAAIDLIEELGGVVVGTVFLIELDDLKGREVLKGYDVKSVLHYAGE